MPYKNTGRPPGRPSTVSSVSRISDAARLSCGLDEHAAQVRARLAGLIASELTGRTQAELADALGWSVSELRRALRGRAINPPKKQEQET
jgi:hypothetical protein